MKTYVLVALYFVLVDVRVVVHLTFDVAVNVVVVVEGERREEQAQERTPGGHADKAVGVGSAGWDAGLARGLRLLTTGAEPLGISTEELYSVWVSWGSVVVEVFLVYHQT